MNQIPLFDAKNRLSALVHDAESGSPVELTRHGKPVAVVLGREAYDRLQEEQRVGAGIYNVIAPAFPVLTYTDSAAALHAEMRTAAEAAGSPLRTGL